MSFFILVTAFAFPYDAVVADDPQMLEKLGAKVKLVAGRVVDVNASCDGWTDADFARLGEHVEVTNLSLSGKSVTDQRLGQLSNLINLESMMLNNARISNDGFLLFQKFPKLKRLSLFHQSRDMKELTGNGLVHLKPLSNLKQLTFAGTTTGDIGMEAVGELTQLESYSQWHNLETSAGMENLCKLTQLKSLRLGQRLHDWKPNVKPASFDDATFAILSQMTSLESLEIMEARLSFAALSQLKHLPRLKRLKISKVAISAEEVERLKQVLPQTKIDWEPLTKEQASELITKLKI